MENNKLMDLSKYAENIHLTKKDDEKIFNAVKSGFKVFNDILMSMNLNAEQDAFGYTRLLTFVLYVLFSEDEEKLDDYISGLTDVVHYEIQERRKAKVTIQ